MNNEDEIFRYFDVTKNVISLVPSNPIIKVNYASETVITTCIALPNELIFVD